MLWAPGGALRHGTGEARMPGQAGQSTAQGASKLNSGCSGFEG